MPDTLGLGAGIGGRDREKAISNYVDKTQTGEKAPSPNSQTPLLSADKQHPALRDSQAYKAAPTERATHQYGAPISAPILHGGR